MGVKVAAGVSLGAGVDVEAVVGVSLGMAAWVGTSVAAGTTVTVEAWGVAAGPAGGAPQAVNKIVMMSKKIKLVRIESPLVLSV